MKVVYLLVSVFFLGGCLVRTYTVEKQRVDMRLEGNQGYLSGTPAAPADKKDTRLGKTRKMSVVEIEFGHHLPQDSVEKKPVRKVETAKFNPQDFYQNEGKEEERDTLTQIEPINADTDISKKTEQYQWYTILKNDTLQKISYKFYKTTKKWLIIYEQNKDILGAPDKIYPGRKIRIPN